MKNILIAFFLLVKLPSHAQSKYPQGYFQNPLGAGVPISLSGCYGDIRINHFHSGLDIRTEGREGKSIFAAADGYVSRILVQNGGYGNALYITHPNGLTTVYAHLKSFNAEVQQFLTEKQYEQKKWEIDLLVPEEKLQFKKGELVAYSGNTGGSGGPHLHFEIRDGQENTIDPQLFGFREIKDSQPPIIEYITLKCMSLDARINGKFGSYTFKVVKSAGGYTIPQKISAKGIVGVEILTYDKTAGSPFRLGVNSIELKMNDTIQYKFQIEKMSFSGKEDMNIHVDYERMIRDNQKIHKCYVEESNGFDFYESNKLWGKLDLKNQNNKISIKVRDSHKNTSNLNFNITYDKSNYANETSKNEVSVLDNFLKIITTLKETIGLVNVNGKEISLTGQPISTGGQLAVYDMDEGFPALVKVGNEEIKLPINMAITLNFPKITYKNLRGNFNGTLYDNAFIQVSVSDDYLNLHQDIIPLQSYAELQWKKSTKPDFQEKLKVYLDGKKPKFIGGEWDQNTITFKTREFGTYVTLYDFDPPIITPKTVNAHELRFSISDNLSGIRKIECYVNGEWVLMDYEYKTGAIWSRKLDQAKPFSGTIILKVIDNCNNTQSFESNIL